MNVPFKCGLVVMIAAFALAGVIRAQPPAPLAAQGGEHHAHFLACAKACADCAVQCDSCYRHCAELVKGGSKQHAKSMELCVDCAEFCRLSQSLSARGSPLAGYACESCAKSCDDCAGACETMKDDKHMTECAKSCRDCAKACRDMVKMIKN
jgi:hypothetical protein